MQDEDTAPVQLATQRYSCSNGWVNLDSWVDAYLDHLRVERALSPRTISAYASDLAKFLRHADTAGVHEPSGFDAQLVSGFLVALGDPKGAPISARSAARHLSSIRGFAKFLRRERAISIDPCGLIDRPRVGRRLPKVLSVQDIASLLNVPSSTTPRGIRDRAMLFLVYAAGLRVSELVSMRMGDVDRRRGVVSALGKGDKRRLVPIGEPALRALDLYLEVRKHARGAATPVLFLSPSGKPLTRQAFWKIAKRTARGLGLGPDVSPHKFRHSFATHLLQGGADLRSVQAMLGHANVSTTEIYTHVAEDHVRSVHRRSHPRG